MFDSFIRWLDGYLRDHEPSAVLKAAASLLAFASVLGAFFGSQAVRTGAFVAVALCLVAGVLLLLADRHGIKQERDRYLQRLNWYYKVLSESSAGPLIAVDSWTQRVEIDATGDVHEVLTLEAVALREHVFFARLTARSLWNQPARQLREIEMSAHSIKADGSQGPTLPITSSWDGEKLYCYLDFDPPIRRGQVVRFRLERTWPAKCLPMMRHKRAEDFVLRTTKVLEVGRAQYCLVLPQGCEAVYELIGEGEPDVRLSAVDEEEPDGRKVYRWCADKIPPNIQVGIKVQLR